jgi:hypothetical protein
VSRAAGTREAEQRQEAEAAWEEEGKEKRTPPPHHGRVWLETGVGR